MADNLTTFVCRLSWNLGTATSWNPQGLSRPVIGLLSFFYRTVDTAYVIMAFMCSTCVDVSDIQGY
jgi:hypothetical protein